MTEAGCTHTQCVRTIHMTEYRLERNSCASHVEEEKTVFCERWYALSYCIILHGIVLHGIAWNCMELHGIKPSGIKWYFMALHPIAAFFGYFTQARKLNFW